MKARRCSTRDCGAVATVKDVCQRCYQRIRRGKEPGPRRVAGIPLTVYLHPDDAKILNAEAKNFKKSISEVIRERIRR